MACGLPVVASLHPPFDELIQPEWGVQVDETDPAAVTRAIAELLVDPAKRLGMGRSGRRRVLEAHTWEKVSLEYLGLLDG